nr:Uncharacterised protein [Raoultella sp. NCTC 9187]
MIVALRRGALFTHGGHVAEAKDRVAVGAIHPLRLRVGALRLRQLPGLQRAVALLNQQPVAVGLQQAAPFVAIRAIRVHGERFIQLRHGAGAIPALRIGLAQRAHGVAVPGIRANGLL